MHDQLRFMRGPATTLGAEWKLVMSLQTFPFLIFLLQHRKLSHIQAAQNFQDAHETIPQATTARAQYFSVASLYREGFCFKPRTLGSITTKRQGGWFFDTNRECHRTKRTDQSKSAIEPSYCEGFIGKPKQVAISGWCSIS